MAPIRCLLAAFDQSHLSADGTYWSWRHPEIPREILDRFYYDFAAKHWPTLDAEPEEAFRGGCARVDARWLSWYRFLNGGRDKMGRPGRYVLVAAFVETQAGGLQDYLGLLQSPLFDALALQAGTECPLPAPQSMETLWNAIDVERDPKSNDFLGNPRPFERRVLQDPLAANASSNPLPRFDVYIVQQTDQSSASIARAVTDDGPEEPIEGSGSNRTLLDPSRVENGRQYLRPASVERNRGPRDFKLRFACFACGVIVGLVASYVAYWLADSCYRNSGQVPSTQILPPAGESVFPAHPDATCC